jgi:hypothetical protein
MHEKDWMIRVVFDPMSQMTLVIICVYITVCVSQHRYN